MLLTEDRTYHCVFWGMPGAVVVNAGLADCVVPLEGVVPEILRRIGAM